MVLILSFVEKIYVCLLNHKEQRDVRNTVYLIYVVGILNYNIIQFTFAGEMKCQEGDMENAII